MDPIYDPSAVERAAADYWSSHDSFRAVEDPSREKFYCLSMFPYPSGHLHMGHVRNYTIGDVIARYQRMCGKNVLQPIGFDAFGLPAENAAIKNRVPPAQWTYSNIETMCAQLKKLGLAYDWSRQLATCQPDYYRWQQWFFIRLLEKGLVERRNARVNWDPVDQTVLANEQVIDGRGWRSGALVEQREIPQWFLKITAYADELLEDLSELTHWPEAVRRMQENWIGRSEGLEIDFKLAGSSNEVLTVFTTRPDTVFGVSFLSVAPQHPLAAAAAGRDPSLAAFLADASRGDATEAALETMEKKGLPLGIDVLHPLTGDRIPVWTANFVLMSYGSGAVMGVPGHDQRDWEFATKYGLPIRAVVSENGAGPDLSSAAWTGKGHLINSGGFDGLDFGMAFAKISGDLEARNAGRRRINYRLRDWGVSRQRYWGCPIPIVYCEHCGAVPVPDDQLPVRLPEELLPDGRGNPLLRCAAFVDVACPRCGAAARRETDTFDTFVDSSWYYARFASAGSSTGMVDARASYWLPVDQYIGGIEHAILHLLYARFFSKLMRDCGLPAVDEPFARLLTQGMVLAEGFYRTTESGGREWIAPRDVAVVRDGKGALLSVTSQSDGLPVIPAGLGTMSKSKNNGVAPETIIQSHGVDAARLFSMFAAPPEQTMEWSDAGIDGAARFLKRLWKLTFDHVDAGPSPAMDAKTLTAEQKQLRQRLHDALAKIGDDFARRFSFNTSIAACMELVNALSRIEDGSANGRAVRQEVLEALVRVLAPIVPHITHALWTALGRAGPVIDAGWPKPDPTARVAATVVMVVQVNGKLRGRIEVPSGASDDEVIATAKADESVQKFLIGQGILKTIVVKAKLVNFVVAS